MPKQVEITSDEITLGQFLKFADFIGSGGEVKHFLQENKITVNGQPENRRGRKLRAGDVIDVKGFERVVITSAASV